MKQRSLLCTNLLLAALVCNHASFDHHGAVRASVEDLNWMTGSWAGPIGT